MKKNITVCIDERTYRKARVWAAARNISISVVVAYLLETLPGISKAALAFPPAQVPIPIAPTPSTNGIQNGV